MSDATMVGLGRLPWGEVVEACTEMTCAWADYAGFHIGPCPDAPPPYSHLWGWSTDGQTLVRVRVDDQEGIVGLLYLGGGVPQSAPLVERVKTRTEPALTWPENHDQIGEQAMQGLGDAFTLVRVLSPAPITFVSQ